MFFKTSPLSACKARAFNTAPGYAVTPGEAHARRAEEEGGGVQRFAVLSFDGVMHGPRRGSDLSPEDLLFNVRNPAAARDNSLQGGADLFKSTQHYLLTSQLSHLLTHSPY